MNKYWSGGECMKCPEVCSQQLEAVCNREQRLEKGSLKEKKCITGYALRGSLFPWRQLLHYCFSVCFVGQLPCFLICRVSIENNGPGSRENPEPRHRGVLVESNPSPWMEVSLWDHYAVVSASVHSARISKSDTLLQLNIRWLSLSTFKSGFNIIRIYSLALTEVAHK